MLLLLLLLADETEAAALLLLVLLTEEQVELLLLLLKLCVPCFARLLAFDATRRIHHRVPTAGALSFKLTSLVLLQLSCNRSRWLVCPVVFFEAAFY